MSNEHGNPKDYIGDSVYVEWDGCGITLTTENDFGPTNTIYLEPEVIASLRRFLLRVTQST